MNAVDPRDARFDRRRREIIRGLAATLAANLAGAQGVAWAGAMGDMPGRMPAGRSIFRIEGTVTVNGAAATLDTALQAGDEIVTGRGAQLVGVIGADGIFMKENTRLQIAPASAAKRFFRLVTGALLTAFETRSRGSIDLQTPTATIGIRGTGVYAEALADRSYLCTCYGTTELSATAGAEPGRAPESETIISQHHDAPRWILAEPDSGRRIIPAPFINHTDAELMMLESLLGRTVPFGVGKNDYDRPRRDY